MFIYILAIVNIIEIQEYFDKKKDIQKELLHFLDDNTANEENYQNLQKIFKNQQIGENVHELKLVLRLINEIASNHRRYPNFFSKIDKVLLIFKDAIKKHLTNVDIFQIFQNNKRILLFLIQNDIFYIDQEIYDKMTRSNLYYWYGQYQHYEQYFTPELRKQLDMKKINNSKLHLLENLPKDFEEKRKNGENDDKLSEIIRNDQIENFINYINQNDLPLNYSINSSIYETNYFLLADSYIELIYYAAFHGSIQIFKYLYSNKVELEPALWLYAVHGDNLEIIKILEENKIIPDLEKIFILDNMNYFTYLSNLMYGNPYYVMFYDHNLDYDYFDDPEDKSVLSLLILLDESIRCHHNKIANYLIDKLGKDEFNRNLYTLRSCLGYHNYDFIQNEIINHDLFFYFLCKFDYISPIQLILNNPKTDNKINKSTLKWKFEKRIVEHKVTPLLAAFETKNIELIKILISSNKINLNEAIVWKEIYKSGHNFYRIYHEYHDIHDIYVNVTLLSLLLERCTIKDFGGIEEIDMIKLLLTCKNIDVNAQFIKSTNYTSIYLVDEKYLPPISSEKPESLLSQMKSSFIINCRYREYPLLVTAIGIESIEIIKLLLENKNIDINKYGKTSKYHEHYNPREGDYSGEADYDEKSKEITPLMVAIKRRNIEIIKLLLSYKNIDINLPYIHGSYNREEKNTFQRDEGYCEYYLDERTTVNDSVSPLIFAYENDEIEIFNLLLNEKNIDVNFVRKYNEDVYSEYRGDCERTNTKKETTLFYQLIDNKNIEIAKLLLSKENIDVNSKNLLDKYHERYYMKRSQELKTEEEIRNETSLYLAIRKRDNELIELLLSNDDIDINSNNTLVVKNDGEVKTEKEETPLQYALSESNVDLAGLLSKHIKIDLNVDDI